MEEANSLKISNEAPVEKFDATILSQALNLSPKVYEQLTSRLLESAEIAKKVLEAPDFNRATQQAFDAKDYDVTPAQIASHMPEDRALPDFEMETDFSEQAVKEFLTRDITHFQTLIRSGLQRNFQKREIVIDQALLIMAIVRNPLGCCFSNVKNSEPGAMHYIPDLEGFKEKELKSIEKTIRVAIATYLTNPELKSEWERFPEWLLICPRGLLKADYLKKNRAFLHTLVSALEQHIFLRSCAALHLDDMLSKPEFETVWEAFIKKQLRHHSGKVDPRVAAYVTAILTHRGKKIPKKFIRYLTPTNEPLNTPESTAAQTASKVTPIIEAPELNYAPAQQINCRSKNNHLEISTAPWPEGIYLHLVVRGVGRSKRTQNTTIYCFASWEELQTNIIDKPQNFDYQISAFLCDRSNSFPNANSTSNVPEEFWCETKKIIDPAPQVATQIEPPLNQSIEPQLPRNLRTPLTKCQPCVEAMAIANELDWQTHLAEQLIDHIDTFEELFESIDINGSLITFEPRTGEAIFNCLEPFTVNADTLKITEPTFQSFSSDLDEDLMKLLVDWAQAKHEQKAALEARESHRREISEWRQATAFRKAKGKACREALSFRPWEDYQIGVHQGPKGVEFPLYAWDKACVSRDYLPRVKHLAEQLEKAGISVTFEKAALESAGQRDVVLDSLVFTLKDVGLKFQLKINREAESPSEIFALTFEENTPESWQNEAARWAIGTVCMMGIITLPQTKSPLNSGKKDRPNDVSHFSFKAERRRAKSTKESKSSYLNLVTRLNNEKGRIKSIANSRGFVWDGSWADFADAGLTVYQNSFFKEENNRDAAKSTVDYDLILNDTRWQKYAVLRLWQTLKQGQKFEDLTHRSSVGAYSEGMTKVAFEAWALLTPEEQKEFASITSPTDAAEFTFTHGEAGKCNFIRTLITMWQQADIGLFVQSQPIYVTFETVMQHCQKEGVEIIARSQKDLDAIEELGLPDLKIRKDF